MREALDLFKAPPIQFTKSEQYFPTYQIGQDQPTPDDYGNFQRSGYRGNSLIYSLIRFRATSYAGLPFVLVTPNGDMIDRHQVLELLEAPNETMDGDEFRTTLRTHVDAAGQAYIVKGRKPNPYFPERNAWPVKDLCFLRPDYVEIKPGSTRERDMFVVKIDGRVVARYERKDIIHVMEPDPTNDFYGLSKIAVIMREGDLDQRITDFDRSFFLHAGVPMGIFMTKTPVNKNEKREIKSAFKRAAQGVQRWFDVLVMNADEGKYQQLGLPQSDMEAEKTRDHVESRMCAVCGVPAILVGANVGLKHSTYANYAISLRAYWTETGIPDAKFVAGALTRELYAEFRTTSERGNKLAHDFNTIDALQDDNSAKVLAAAGLIREIGNVVPVNEVLTLVGLPNVESGDQIVPKAPAPTFGNPQDAIPAKWRVVSPPRIQTYDRSNSFAKSFRQRHIDERLPIIDAAAKAIANYLDDLALSICNDLLIDKAFDDLVTKVLAPDRAVGPEEELALTAVVQPYVEQAMRSGWTLAALELAIDTAFDIEDPWIKRLLADAGDRIQGITQTTREAVQETLLEANAQGLSLADTADLLRAMPEFSESRAMMIARTEISTAQNRASIGRWKASGMVQEVLIFDGDSDEACATANGQTWTLDEFDANPSEHPNCIRTATPVRVEVAA